MNIKKIIPSLFILLVSNLLTAQTVPENLGAGVNTNDHSEATPVLSPDGKFLYFSRLMDTKTWDDIFYSELLPDGTWSTAKSIDELNNELRNQPAYIFPDGNTIIFTTESDAVALDPRDGYYRSHRTTAGWSKPEKLKFETELSSYESSSPTFSLDGKTMILSLNADLHISFLKNNDTWSTPVPLSSTINIAREFTPFLASDDKTLYYSGARADSYGRNDIYKTTRLDDTWLSWSEPVNLGSTVNTSGWESSFRINTKGDYAYYYDGSNSIATRGDIVRVPLAKENKPKPVVLVSGKVYDSKTKLPIQANIQYEMLPNGTSAASVSTNPKDGFYSIVLPYGNHYGYHASAAGYIGINESLNLDSLNAYEEIKQDLYLVPLEIGISIKLNNVFFVQSKPEMLPSSYPELDRLVKILQDNSTIVIELRGHTDNTGDPKLNFELSENRVKTVKKYLVSKGINDSRISGKGYGGTKPIASNDSEASKKLNRRVEFVIVKM